MTPPEQLLRAALLMQKLHAAVVADTGQFGAAHRRILDLHAPFTGEGGDKICVTCLEGNHLYAVLAYPCPTLVTLAEAYDISMLSPQGQAFVKHLDAHHCADERHPDFMGGFGNCPEAMRLFNLQPPYERVLTG